MMHDWKIATMRELYAYANLYRRSIDPNDVKFAGFEFMEHNAEVLGRIEDEIKRREAQGRTGFETIH